MFSPSISVLSKPSVCERVLPFAPIAVIPKAETIDRGEIKIFSSSKLSRNKFNENSVISIFLFAFFSSISDITVGVKSLFLIFFVRLTVFDDMAGEQLANIRIKATNSIKILFFIIYLLKALPTKT